MQIRLRFVFLILAASTLFSKAQPYQLCLNIPVIQNGNQLKNPWVGGFDAPIFSPIDLNGDGIKDLFVFEKGGASQKHFRYTTYLNMGTANQVDYVYAPQFEAKFPAGMHDWVILVDYDCDGREDIFTSNLGGLRVYHNDPGLNFNKTYDVVLSTYPTGLDTLHMSSANQSAFSDIDGDGDIDVLTFVSSGFSVEYHKNLAEENFGRCDTLVYDLETSCWGNFSLNGFTNTALLNISCRMGYSLPLNDDEKTDLHSGSCAFAADLDGDGDKDYINGDILGNNLLYIKNGGTPSSALMTDQDTAFPHYNVAVDFRAFPSAYYFDADNDGNKDLVVAPCISTVSRNFKNILFYKNTTNDSSNVFNYVRDDLLTDEMIEVGSGANVALTDIDGDGLQDMIIGNYKYSEQFPPDSSLLVYYRNTGTATQPAYTLVTTNYANINLGVLALYPAFGDLDGDLDKDMIIGGDDGYLDYFQNTAGPGNPANYVLSQVHLSDANGNAINKGTFSAPFIVDLNRDGLNDLVIGEKLGNLNYYQNTGTATTPVFTLITENLGGVSVAKSGEDLYGYSAPFFYDSLGTYVLYCGSQSGYIYRYTNIDNNLLGTFNLADSMFLYEPVRSTVAGADINGDGKLDLLVGNYAGGVCWYSNTTTSVNELAANQNFFYLYPNPANDKLFLKLNQNEKNTPHQVIISDLLGKVIYSTHSLSDAETVNLNTFSNGMYICQIIEDGLTSQKKFIVHH